MSRAFVAQLVDIVPQSDVCAGEIGAAGFGSVQGAFGGEGDDRAVAVETTVAVVTAGGYVAGSDTQGFALDSAFDFELGLHQLVVN
ncbi:hypothetical protein BGZ79_005638 [Entomortierella chlamydospora]|nr:hypothetical protein BGZ79_005638 [Entomortierella chlamydospora]